VPEGEHLFIANKYKYLDNKKKPFADELPNYVKQKPNRNLGMIIPFNLWIYDLSNVRFDSVYQEYYNAPESKRNQYLLDSLYIKYNLEKSVGHGHWFGRYFHNAWGEPPVLMDTLLAEKSAKNLQQYFINRGWRKNRVTDSLLIKSRKKASTQYNLTLGQPTIIDSIFYDISDPDIARIYQRVSKHSYVKKGGRLDAFVIEKDISRIETIMQNHGYYGFNELKDEMIYIVDTANSIYQVPVTVSIRKSPYTGFPQKNQIFADEDTLKTDSIKTPLKFKTFTYGEINITLNRNKRLNSDQPVNLPDKPSVEENGYVVINNNRHYNNRVLSDMMVIEKGKTYRLNDEVQTRKNIYKLNNFNIDNFETKLLTDSTVQTNLILTPMEKYSFELSFEGFTSRVASFGVTPKLSFLAKNLFGNAENLAVSFNLTAGNIASKRNNDKLFNASEFSGQATLTFPRWLLPFNTENMIPKRWGASTSISAGYSAQFNIGLDRRNYLASLSYDITPTPTTVHKFILWNLQYTQFLHSENYFRVYSQDGKVKDSIFSAYVKEYPSVDLQAMNYNEAASLILNNADFKNILLNSSDKAGRALWDSYNLVETRRYIFTQNVLISSFGYNFTYDQRLNKSKINPFYLHAGVELAGNILSIFNKSYDKMTTSGNQEVRQIFDVPYSQFAKFDLDLRKYWNFTTRKTLAARFLMGLGHPYGNSFAMPFDRNYSVGGPNDIRAWKAFGLGPGSSNAGSKDGFELIALQNFKLLSSVEYRFPITEKSWEGGLFIDAGNIWATDNSHPNVFKINTFYKELGIGSGWGIRWNMNYFILRLDFAYKIHDPSREEGDRWTFKYINPLKFRINFGIGYPF
jgi:outer membrane protein assembly factor BamA